MQSGHVWLPYLPAHSQTVHPSFTVSTPSWGRAAFLTLPQPCLKYMDAYLPTYLASCPDSILKRGKVSGDYTERFLGFADSAVLILRQRIRLQYLRRIKYHMTIIAGKNVGGRRLLANFTHKKLIPAHKILPLCGTLKLCSLGTHIYTCAVYQ